MKGQEVRWEEWAARMMTSLDYQLVAQRCRAWDQHRATNVQREVENVLPVFPSLSFSMEISL